MKKFNYNGNYRRAMINRNLTLVTIIEKAKKKKKVEIEKVKKSMNLSGEREGQPKTRR